jgi:hypothetical protein
MQLTCQGTCYMPVVRGEKEIQYRFEEGDVAEVPEDQIEAFLGTGMFTETTAKVKNPILVNDPEASTPEVAEAPEAEEPEAEEPGTEEPEAGAAGADEPED